MDRKNIERVIQQLESVRLRPMMFVGPDLKAMIPWLNGFLTGCLLGDLDMHRDGTYIEIVQERGWEYLSAAGVLPSMHSRGLDDAAIADELLAIEIEAWKRRLKHTQGN